MRQSLLLILLAAVMTTANAPRPEQSVASLFDGKTLEGWSAPDMSYWSVEDEAITAESTEDHPCTKNQFLVWQGGEMANFILRFQFRMMGGEKANSGVQVRSQLDETGHAVGYQADISQPDAPWLGAIYDEHGRKILAQRGERVIIEADGSKEVTLAETPEEASAGMDITEWTDYEIRFDGFVMSVTINGKLMSEIDDREKKEREASGLLALQLHSGPPMKVQFRNLKLVTLP